MTMTLTMIFPLTLILTLILTLTYTDTDTDTDTEFFFHGWGWGLGAVFRSFSVFLQKQAASVPHVQCIALFGRERGKTETRRETETERGSERDTERETETDREVKWKNNNSCFCHRILMLSVHITPCPCSDLVTPKIRGCSLI